MITILIVDDHDLVRTALSRLLSEVKGIQVVGEASDGEKAMSLLNQLKPNIVLMDVTMPGIGGIETTRKILRLHPHVKVLVLSSHTEEPFPTRLLQAGALGYITKGASLDEMVQAIRTVHSGRRYLSPEIAQQMALQRFSDKEETPFDDLSERELQVMLMITNGMKPNEIGKKLNLSPKTINSYRYRLFEKLGVKTDVELTHLAMHRGMLDIDDLKDG
jgi:two-component system invasion response regulator UvrY